MAGARAPSRALAAAVSSAALLCVARAQTPLALVDGAPSAGVVAGGAYAYFSYAVPAAAAGAAVEFILTASFGDPDLYVSNSSAQPTTATYTWAQATEGPELITVAPSDPSYSSTLYTIGVYGYGSAPSAYTLTAVAQVAPLFSIALLPGAEQAQVAPPHAFAYFTLSLAGAGTPLPELDITASPLSGDVDIYVSVSGATPTAYCATPAPGAPGNCSEWAVTAGTFNYSSVSRVTGIADFVAIPGSALAAGTPVCIGVLATSPDSVLALAPPSLFAVVAGFAGSAVRLNNGLATAGVVGAAAVRLYNFTFTTPDDVVISAEFGGGSLDLFASATTFAPGPGSSTWNSTQTGGFAGRRRLLYLPWASYGAAACPAVATAGCTIFLSVIGAAGMSAGVQAAYTLVASVTGDPSQPAPLVNGVQVLARVPPQASQYYFANVAIDPSQAIYVLATDVSAGGSLQLYAALGAGAAPPSPLNNFLCNVTTTDFGGYARLLIGPGASSFGGYCSSCPLFVTLRSTSNTAPSDVGLLFTAGPAFVPLADAQATPGVLSGNGSAFFSYAVTDPLADITFTFSEVSGGIVAYLLVVSPARPYVAPSFTTHTYAVLPATGASSLTIARTDPLWCAPKDGSASGAPCTYAIAVYATDPSAFQTEFSVLATADSSGAIVQLVDGQLQDGAVAEGAFAYYTLSPGAGVAPIVIAAEAYSGAVAVYVTNAYVPGVSAPGLLPGPGVGCWAATDRAPIVIAPGDACLSSALGTYTIAVQGAAGVPGYTTPFYVTAAASQPYQTIKLELGVPITNVAVAANGNAYFAFDLPSTDSDVVITASPLYGSITAAVSKHSYGFVTASTPPSCAAGVPGAQGFCTNWVWLATGIAGASAMRIPAAAPCAPTTGASLTPPMVNTTAVGASNACTLAWRPGRFWFVVYAWTDAVVTVAVQLAGKTTRLSDGQQQLALTAPTTLCATHNPLSGNCMGDPSAWLSGLSAAFLRFQAPELLSVGDQSLLVERICQQDYAGACGNPLQVYIHSCVAGACTTADAFASPLLYESKALVSDALVALAFPSCYGANAPGTADCVYSVGIFPQCPPAGGAPLPFPGNCSDALARVTWAGDSAPQMLPADCTGNARSCNLPAANVGVASRGGIRRYASFANNFGVAINVQVAACTGALSVYLCTNMANSVCAPADSPSPTNSDQAVGTAADPTGRGNASLSFTPSLQANFDAPFYFGVAVDTSGQQTNPSYSVTLSSSQAPMLSLPSSPSPVFARFPSYVLIEWQYPTLLPNHPVTQSVEFTVYIFASANPAPAYNLASPCGIDAYTASLPQGQLPVVYSTGDTTFNISGLDPGTTYTVALKALCGAGACMPANSASQTIAYTPITTTRVVTASPSPNPAAPPAKSHGGAVAGGVIGGLLAAGVLGAGGFYAYKRWLAGGFGGGGGAAYSRFSVQSSSSAAAKDDGTLYSAL